MKVINLMEEAIYYDFEPARARLIRGITMALKEFEFGFGRTTQKVKLPEEHILDVLEGNPTPACDVKEATIQCMRHPIGSKPPAGSGLQGGQSLHRLR